MFRLRRIEELLPLSPLFSLRERLAARKFPERKAQFQVLREARSRERLFVVGNAPSLKHLDLRKLDGEDYMLVNMAEHMEWTQGKTHPYYLAADTGVTRKYENGRPKLKAQTYFYAAKLEQRLAADFVEAAKPFFFAPAKGGIKKRGLLDEPWIAVPSGPTILLSGVQIGWALGYRKIYVIGCDLDYAVPDPYAYRTTEVERERAKQDDEEMREQTNSQFAILRDSMERQGGKLVNAGEGGRLESLPRGSFVSLFPI